MKVVYLYQNSKIKAIEVSDKKFLIEMRKFLRKKKIWKFGFS